MTSDTDIANTGENTPVDKAVKIKEILEDPEIMKGLAEAFINIQKANQEKESQERKKLDKRLEIEADEYREKKEIENNAKAEVWYDKRIAITRLPFGKDRQQEVIKSSLEWLETEVEENRISYTEACKLMDLAIINEELDLNDKMLQFDPKYSEIKELYSRSDFKNRRIVKPEVLEHAYSETLKQMKNREYEHSTQQRKEHARYNSNYTIGQPIYITDYNFGDAVNMSIIGANRINPMLKNLTKDEYQEKYAKQLLVLRKDLEAERPRTKRSY